jgi:hypothetical protein
MISIIELVLLEAISFSFRSIRNGSIFPQFFPMHSMASNLHHKRIALPGFSGNVPTLDFQRLFAYEDLQKRI